MQLFYLLSLALLAVAQPCYDAKCDEALDNALPITKTITPTSIQTCAASKCFGGIITQPSIASIASSFCKTFINVHDSTVTSTVSVTATITSTRTPPTFTPLPSTSTVVTVPTITKSSVCSVTVTVTTTNTVPFLTEKFFISRSTAAASTLVPRNAAPSIPIQLIRGCPTGSSLNGILSSACSCIVKPTTITKTSTISVTSTVVTTAATSTLLPSTVTTVISKPITTTVCGSTQTDTATFGVTITGAASCGVPIPATATTPISGQITCPVVGGGETNEYTRLEGSDSEGLIFEGCIASGPEEITTPSGGTHECDGTNNNANPNPGANGITQIQSAATADDFTFDGTFDTEFDDFFISRISDTTQTSSDFWGILINQVFTPVAGCEAEVSGGTEELLWAFNAFNVNAFLTITPQYAIVPIGTATFTVNVQGHDGNGNTSPFSGAMIQGGSSGVTDANGNIAIDVPVLPGCYEYKATASSAIRSNIFYLSVVL